MNGRRDGGGGGGARSEDGVGEFEESVAPAVEAFVERVAEAVESIGRFHDAPIMHSPTAFRTPYLPVKLKRKLRHARRKKVQENLRNPLNLTRREVVSSLLWTLTGDSKVG